MLRKGTQFAAFAPIDSGLFFSQKSTKEDHGSYILKFKEEGIESKKPNMEGKNERTFFSTNSGNG